MSVIDEEGFAQQPLYAPFSATPSISSPIFTRIRRFPMGRMTSRPFSAERAYGASLTSR